MIPIQSAEFFRLPAESKVNYTLLVKETRFDKLLRTNSSGSTPGRTVATLQSAANVSHSPRTRTRSQSCARRLRISKKAWKSDATGMRPGRTSGQRRATRRDSSRRCSTFTRRVTAYTCMSCEQLPWDWNWRRLSSTGRSTSSAITFDYFPTRLFGRTFSKRKAKPVLEPILTMEH